MANIKVKHVGGNSGFCQVHYKSLFKGNYIYYVTVEEGEGNFIWYRATSDWEPWYAIDMSRNSFEIVDKLEDQGREK